MDGGGGTVCIAQSSCSIHGGQAAECNLILLMVHFPDALVSLDLKRDKENLQSSYLSLIQSMLNLSISFA